MFVVVMGITASGKTTLGRALAERLALPFYDADAYHSPESRAKMAADIALEEADRGPWPALLVGLAASWHAAGGAVLACSALKQVHRDVLLEHVPEHLEPPTDALSLRPICRSRRW